MIPQLPFIRVIVVSFNGADLTLKCLQSLTDTQWPSDRLEIVLVDNASEDDVVERCQEEFAHVRIIQSLVNTGFAGGCNLGLTTEFDHSGAALQDFDHVALINNDATADSAWLEEMNRVMESDPEVGAVAAKVLLTPKYSEILVTPEGTQAEKSGFIGIHGVRINGSRRDDRLRFDETFLRDTMLLDTPKYWTQRGGAIRIVETDGDPPGPLHLEIGVELVGDFSIAFQSGLNREIARSSGDAKNQSPVQWVPLVVDRQSFDLINSVGCELYRRGFGGDRGYLERDHQQFETSVEIFAWSGAAVLLRRSYLEDVGLFDNRLFLYYEDFDLSWRGRLAGWRYLYAPRAVIRHSHAQTSIEGSDLFSFYTTRNRLLVLAKNAPFRIGARAGLGEIYRLINGVFREVFLQIANREKPSLQITKSRWKVVKSYLGVLPSMLYQRWTMERRVPRRSLMVWQKDKEIDPGFNLEDLNAHRKIRESPKFN